MPAVDRVSVAAVGLGLVQGGVGAFDEMVRLQFAIGDTGEHADGERHGVVAVIARRRQGTHAGNQVLDHLACAFGRRIRQHQRELVAP